MKQASVISCSGTTNNYIISRKDIKKLRSSHAVDIFAFIDANVDD